MTRKEQSVEWVLRIAIFGEFLGHAMFALQGKATWIGWIQYVLSVDIATATTILTLIGIFDLLVAFAVLFWRNIPRAVLLWAALWGLWTALLRPIVGDSFWDFVERWANSGAPLALLLLRGLPTSVRGWFQVK